MKKILFSDMYSLTKSVLERRKTQTRRLVPKDFFTLAWDERGDTLVYENEEGDFIDIRDSKYAIFKVGEIVAIAQRYSEIGIEPFPFCENGWNNKMFVRAEACKHQIRITSVRSERLQDITDEDCMKEGIQVLDGRYYYRDSEGRIVDDFDNPRAAFASLINKISGRGTWERNPFVWVYEFKLVK